MIAAEKRIVKYGTLSRIGEDIVGLHEASEQGGRIGTVFFRRIGMILFRFLSERAFDFRRRRIVRDAEDFVAVFQAAVPLCDFSPDFEF